MSSMHNTLSVIQEVDEVSISDRHASQLDLTGMTGNYGSRSFESNLGGIQAQQLHHMTSFLSSDTSYGDVLPQDKATLGFGTQMRPYYDKSLPSIPRESVTAKTASARSAISPAPSNQGDQPFRYSQGSSEPAQYLDNNRLPSNPGELSPRLSREFESHPQPLGLDIAHSYPTERPPSFPEPLLPGSIPATEVPAKAPSERQLSVRSRSSKSIHPSPPPDYKSLLNSPSFQAHSEVKLASVRLSPSKKSKSLTTSSTTSTSTSTRSASTGTASPNSGGLIASQTTLRTFNDVVDEVATSLALRAKMQAESITSKISSDVVKVGVCMTMSHTDDQLFLYTLAAKIHHAMTLQHSYLFALCPSIKGESGPATLIFCGAPQRLVTKASILAGLRFKTRLSELQDQEGTWTGALEASPGSPAWAPILEDEDVLWDIVRKAAIPTDPMAVPAGSRGADQLVLDARTRLDRLSPREAYNESYRDGILVDTRPEAQRIEYGGIPGAVIIERNDLEWRFDPRCTNDRLPIADRYDLRVIVFCQDGRSSSLAAASLQSIGLWRATDIEGGFLGWESGGLPIYRVPYDASFVASESLYQNP